MKSASVAKILPIEAKRGELPAYPQVGQFEQLERRLTAAMGTTGELRLAMEAHDLQRLSAAVDSTERLRCTGEINRLLGELHSALAPATVEEIGARVAILISSFPNPGKEVPETYGRLLAEDVSAQNPTRLGLEMACRHVRRTVEWLPKISQVLDALEKIETWIRHAPKSLKKVPELIGQAQVSVAVERRWREREEARKTHTRPLVDDGIGPRLQALAAELRERDRRPKARRAPPEPALVTEAVADALAGVRGAAGSATLTAKEAMAKHRSQQASPTDQVPGDKLTSG